MKSGLASDNYAGVLPEMLEAIVEASRFHAKSYGYDEFTEKAKQQFEEHFGSDIEVAFVFNGTGANVLGIGCATQSFNSILCADTSHLYVDESTAPEMFSGCRLQPLATNGEGKIEIETVKKSIIRKGDEHYPQAKVFSIAQTTEYGTIYTKEELLAVSKILKANDIVFHMDGARLFNAAVSLKCSLKEITRDVGVDILSVGGTKIGLLFGEAVVFFGKKYSQNLRYRQKQSMQLPSKMRFISAQFYRLLRDEIWLGSAKHANEMAKRLFEGVKDIQKIKITKTVQANSVFAIIPTEWNELLQDQMTFHIWNENTNEVRWMCAFDTEEKDVEEFISLIRNLNNN